LRAQTQAKAQKKHSSAVDCLQLNRRITKTHGGRRFQGFGGSVLEGILLVEEEEEEESIDDDGNEDVCLRRLLEGGIPHL
jgi:hypothetical protein